MRTHTVRTGAALALTAGLLAGCESTPRRAPYADNPLVQSRQPLLQAYKAAGADQVAQSGPKMVAVPPPPAQQPAVPSNVAARPKPDTTATYTPAAPTYTPPAPAAALPVPSPLPAPPPVEMTAPAAPPAPPAPAPLPTAVAPVSAAAPMAPVPPPVTPAVVRQVEGKYGHSADHSWLQGELDRHYRGHLELRFRPASEEDPLGGKVRLEDDPRLAEFRPGDVIAVEGELLTDPEGATPSWSQYRRYHVRAVRLVERK